MTIVLPLNLFLKVVAEVDSVTASRFAMAHALGKGRVLLVLPTISYAGD